MSRETYESSLFLNRVTSSHSLPRLHRSITIPDVRLSDHGNLLAKFPLDPVGKAWPSYSQTSFHSSPGCVRFPEAETPA